MELEFLDFLRPWLIALTISLPRIMVAFLIMPILVETMVSGMVRNGIIIAMTMFLLPLTYLQVLNLEMNVITLLGVIIKEGILGLLIGFIFSIPFWAVRASGFLIDMQRGAMSAMFFSQASGSMTSPFGNVFAQVSITLLFVSGGFLFLLDAIYLTYKIWPIDQFYPAFSEETAKFLLKQVDLLFYTAVLLGGPLVGIMLIVDIGSGLIGRYLPQLNIFLIAMPIKSGLAFFILIFYITFIINYLRDNFIKFGLQVQLLDGVLK